MCAMTEFQLSLRARGRNLAAAFVRCRSAQVAIFYALTLPVLFAVAGFTVDYAGWAGQARKLQGAADAAAVAAAREWYLADASQDRIRQVAETTVKAQFQNGEPADGGLRVIATVDEERGAVEVTVSQVRQAYFTQALATKFPDLSAVAVARAFGGGRLCMLGLAERASGAVELRDDSRITAPDCAIYSNAGTRSGVKVSGRAEIEAELVCSAGGADVTAGSVTPDDPLTDCPVVADPLALRPPPDVGGCDYDGSRLVDLSRPLDLKKNLKNLTTRLFLKPGTYCNGLVISDVNLVLAPGVYVITGGPLVIRSNVVLVGKNVGFYLDGDDATLDFDARTIVDLTAPVDGPLAGILFFEDRDAPADRIHSIRSQGAANLLGTVYLSRGILRIDTNANVANESAYTAIVARRVELRKEPNLFLNADYDATDVPVPAGVGPVGGNVVLER